MFKLIFGFLSSIPDSWDLFLSPPLASDYLDDFFVLFITLRYFAESAQKSISSCW